MTLTPIDQRCLWICAVHQGIGNRNRAYSVVSKASLRVEKRLKDLAAMILELVGGANDVANDSTKHGQLSPRYWFMKSSVLS